MLNSFLTLQKERVLSVHFSDSKQVTIFQKHNTGNITDTLLGEGLAKQMYGWGWGGSLSRELKYLLQTQMLCTSSKTKNRSESGK